MLETYISQALYGISYGLLLFMLAAGLTLIFSMMGVLNFAHASFYMLGAYFGFLLREPLLIGIPIGLVFAWRHARRRAALPLAAALAMVAVFAIFGTLSMQDFKQMGVGLSVAILLDATIVRAVLLPSVMTLLGDRAWALPGWLDRALPKIALEGEPQPA